MKSILRLEPVKIRAIFVRALLAALFVLAGSSLWAQDGLGGAISQLATTYGLWHQPFGQSLAAADFDMDCKPDGALIVDAGKVHGQKAFRIEIHLTGSRNIDLSFESDDFALDIAALDVNRDGAPDIVVENALTHARVGVWLNDGHGSFRKVPIEDFPSAGADRANKIDIPLLRQDFPSLCLPSKSGSDLVVLGVAGPALSSAGSTRHVGKPNTASRSCADEPNPSRGPPSFSL